MEQWWNGTDRGNLKYWERNFIQCGWQMNESVWSNSGTILTGKFELLGEETYSIATLSANLTWQKTEL